MLTSAGRAAAAVSATLAVAGFSLGYRGLLVLAAGLCGTLLLGAVTVLLPARIDARRHVSQTRVVRGEDLGAILTITNSGRRPLGGYGASDQLDALRLDINLPRVAAGETTAIPYLLPASRRGVFGLGPLTISRVDIFGLARRRKAIDGTLTLFVHPVIHRLPGLATGASGLQDPSDRGGSRSGSASFESLREYVIGDDLRRVHWRMSAHNVTGDLLVREYVDHDLPRGAVVLDCARGNHTEDGFEEAIDVVASLLAWLVRDGYKADLFLTDGQERHLESSADDMAASLDTLAGVLPQATDALQPTLRTATSAAQSGSGSGSIFLVSGAELDLERAARLLPGNQFDRCVVVRAGMPAPLHRSAAGVDIVDVQTAHQLVSIWEQLR